MLNPQNLKKDFPFFSHHPDVVYLDSAATALKVDTALAAEREYLEQYSTNISRGLYPLAETATERFEAVREKVARFINASSKEVIFTSGTTDSLNLAAQLLKSRIEAGDNLVSTEMEHHSNFLPWKELAKERGAQFRTLPFSKDGTFDLSTLGDTIDTHTKIVAFSAVSNVLGTINPVQEIVKAIKRISPEAITIIDAAQAIGHMPLSVKEWGADLVAFSGHKLFGPTGVGVLYAKENLLESFSPVRFGGGMVLDACAEETVYKDIPERFEAGTPHISGVIALGAALEFIEKIGVSNIHEHEIILTEYTMKRLQEELAEDVTIIGPKDAALRGGVISFTLKDIHPHDIAHILGEENICVRAGEHCTAPLHRALNLPATTRISFSLYNDTEDIEKLIAGLKKSQTKLL